MAWYLIQLIFIVSGACALAYEVVWGRWLATVLGGSSIAACVILSCYMGGLALGAWVCGRVSARTTRPLMVYVGIELLIGVVAGLFPLVAGALLGLPAWLRVSGAVVTLLAPTFLMGGTLPLVVAWTDRAGLPRGRSLARLYGLNTVGAALGCLLAGFVFIERVGLELTNAFAAATNVLLALVLYLLARSAPEASAAPSAEGAAPSAEPAEQPAPEADAGAPPAPAMVLHALAFVSGLVTLGMEVVWIRLLRILLGSTTYVFTEVIATFILGIGLGGLIAGRLPEDRPVRKRLLMSQAALVALVTAQLVALPYTPHLWGALGQSSWEWTLFGSALISAVFLLPVTVVIGYIFPLLGRLYMARGPAGAQVGHFYTVNTLGAVAGGVLATLVLIPLLGTPWTMSLFLGLLIVSMGLYGRLARAALTRPMLGGLAAVLAVALAVGALRPGWTEAYLGFGAFLPGDRTDGASIVYFSEGRSSTILVEDRDGRLGIRVDGKPVASTVYQDRANQYLLGHLPAMLTPTTKQGLVIGLGSGMTLGALALHGFERIEQVELEPEVVGGARVFAESNYGALDRPEVALVFDDGFNHLHASDTAYDVITSDPIQPFFRGAATLYSVDYFQRASERLTPTGVFAHWLPLGNMSLYDFQMIIRGFTDVFPHARLYWTGSYADAVLVGRMVPWEPGGMVPEQFERARASLRDIYLHSAQEVESLLMADRATLTEDAGPGPRNTINHPLLEFTAPAGMFADTRLAELNHMLAMRRRLPRRDPIWQATTAVLAHRALVQPRKDDALDEAFVRDVLACRLAERDCPVAERSGLARKMLWTRAMRRATSQVERLGLALRVQGAWWYPRGAAAASNEAQARALVEAFEEARWLTSADHPKEPAALLKRLKQAEAFLPPSSPGADALRRLHAETRSALGGAE